MNKFGMLVLIMVAYTAVFIGKWILFLGGSSTHEKVGFILVTFGSIGLAWLAATNYLAIG